MAPPSRRQFIKTSLTAGAGVAISACSGGGGDGFRAPSSSSDPGTAPPSDPPFDNSVSDAFDFPLVTELPFAHGVASGDPLPTRVIIWTRITQEFPDAAVTVVWEVATDPDFANILKHGEQDAIADHDYTIKVDVFGLTPATTYYYRFKARGVTSIVGRTRTAPTENVDDLRFAVVSCSSYWSSYWDGYSRIADLAGTDRDLDLVIHCGDYIYDFVDADEEVRARNGIKDINHVDYRDWLNINECRRRYALYRADPHLCRAHQQHPWSIVWDNHDIDEGYGNELSGGPDSSAQTTTLAETTQVFYEWTPTRPVLADGSGDFYLSSDINEYPVPPDASLMYRKLDYGPMADVLCMDSQYLLQDPGADRGLDTSHLANGGSSLLGKQQFDWMTEAMNASKSEKTWRLIISQTWMSPFSADSVPNGDQLPGISDLKTRWYDHNEERNTFVSYLRDNGIDNNILVSGDMHGNFCSDLIRDDDSNYASSAAIPSTRSGSRPANQAAGFRRSLSAGAARTASVGVEFAPSSMGRGGADELWANLHPASTELDQVLFSRGAEALLLAANANIQFMEWADHGYGIVHMQSDKSYFEGWWQDKLTEGSKADVLGYKMVSYSQDDNGAGVPRYKNQIDEVSLHLGESYTPSSSTRNIALAAPEAVLEPR